jgi:exodeoxyribonuclease V gamma subunit
MSGERSGDTRIFEEGGRQYLPEEVPADQMASAAQFGLLIRSLIEDARSARHDRRPLDSWMNYVTAMFTTYLVPQDDEDERVLRTALKRVNDVADMKLDGKKLHYRIPYELVRSELAGLTGALGQYLVDGVVVSTFLPMRAIPFKVIFIAGLGERQFPAADRKNLLDLRQARRRAGDVSPREQDSYMFLETVLSARDKLYLSYVGRDELTGDRLEPSSVLLELRHMLERGYVGKLQERTFPLRRYDDPHTREASPAAEMEHNVRLLGQDLRDFLKRSGSTPDLRELRKKLPPPVWEQLGEVLGIFEPPPCEGAKDPELDTLTVSIGTIRNFLECPLQGSARFLLRMRDEEDEDVLTREDEAFEATSLHQAIVLRKAFKIALASGEKLTDAYDAVQTRYELKGTLPTGVFGASEREEHLQILNQWRAAYSHLTDGKESAPEIFRFGPAREHANAVDEVLAPVVLEVDVPTDAEPVKRRIEIVGMTQLFLEDPTATLVPLTGKAKPKHVLRGFLDHVLLSAAGRSSGSEHSVCLLKADDKPEPDSFVFSGFTQDEARNYLETLVEDMLSRVHSYLLPCEAFLKIVKGRRVELDEKKLPRNLESLRENVEHTSSQYGPIKNPELCYEPPPEDEALKIIHRRFTSLFDKQL